MTKFSLELDSKIEADRISAIIRRFMEQIDLTEEDATTDKLTILMRGLGSFLSGKTTEIKPETHAEKVVKKPEIIAEKVKEEIPIEKVEEIIIPEKIKKKVEKRDLDSSKILESEYYSPKLEEWRSKIIERLIGRGKIIERLDLLNTQMTENPDDPSNEKRKIERDTLIWILQSTAA